MILDNSLHVGIEQLLGIPIQSVEQIGGGDISDARLIHTNQGSYFLKINNGDEALDLFRTELKGLNLLRTVCRTPTVLGLQTFDQGAFLLMEYIAPGQKDNHFWNRFGKQLATIHRTHAPRFGLDHNNFIGNLPQSNNYEKDWPTFYVNQRLIPQVKSAVNNILLTSSSLKQFDKLYKRMPDICPEESPSLIHGDLWTGNFLISKNQEVVLIDPSVAYAHREMDLAMSLLFGGFSDLFYESYQEHYPLEPGFPDRVDIYQLYYLLVHVNLFGRAYVGAVERIVRRYE